MEDTKQDTWAEQRDKMLEECWENITNGHKLALKPSFNAGYEKGMAEGRAICTGDNGRTDA